VYVDDLVTALLTAAVADQAVGEAFLISGPEPVTWREFYGSYERMLGVSSTVSMTPEEALAHYHASRSSGPMLLGESLRLLADPHVRERLVSTRDGAMLARGLRRLLPRSVQQAVKARVKNMPGEPARTAGDGLPVHPLRPARIRLFAAPTTVRIDKAARLLAYRPRFNLTAGMSMTREWARWANLIA
jgi:nucleoside-diphosphate-sugar epimerase